VCAKQVLIRDHLLKAFHRRLNGFVCKFHLSAVASVVCHESSGTSFANIALLGRPSRNWHHQYQTHFYKNRIGIILREGRGTRRNWPLSGMPRTKMKRRRYL
jgi:hypothetical protein